MKHSLKIIVIGIILTMNSCNSQNSKIEQSINDFDFKSIVSNYKGDKSKGLYCILGQNIFNQRHSENTVEMIQSWIKNHPNSKVIPVTALKMPTPENPNHKFVYCWITDGDESLNNYLVKNGCLESKSMERMKTWVEMTSSEKKTYNGKAKPEIEVFIDNKTYSEFILKIKISEKKAKQKRLGIWSN